MNDHLDDATPEQPSWFSGPVPYVAPLLTFLVLSWGEQALADQWPYELRYALKFLATALVMAFCWRVVPRWNSQGMGWAIAYGVIGLGIWLGLDQVQRQLAGSAGWNFLVSEREGYEFAAAQAGIGEMGFLLLRLAGLTVLIPLVEEIFWRGFLARFLISEQFQTVPHGTTTWWSFVVTTAAFAAVHPEVLAALVWGAGIQALWIRTQNLWACIVAHAVTNAGLGIYILATASWHLW